MTPRIRPMTDLLLAVAGPIVWAAHFFGLYLAEALLCPAQGSAPQPGASGIGAALTALALAAMLAVAIRHRRQARAAHCAALAFALPLTLLSAVGVLWTSLPLLLLPACAPGGA